MAGSTWIVIGVAAALYVVTSIRVAQHMGKIGRSAIAWFFITLLLTAIPAAIVQRKRQHKSRPAQHPAPNAPSHCRHCGSMLKVPGSILPPGVNICQSCGMKLDEDYYA